MTNLNLQKVSKKSLLTFITEGALALGSKGFIGQVIRLSRVCDDDITVFSRKDKKNLAMGKLKQTQSIQDIELFEVICI